MLDDGKGMPDERTLSDLPARVDYLCRKKALLLSCAPPAPALQTSLAAQPSALATRVHYQGLPLTPARYLPIGAEHEIGASLVYDTLQHVQW